MSNQYFNDVSLLWCSRYDYEHGWRLKEHSHDFYQIIYVIDGTADAVVNTIHEELSNRKLIFIRPKDKHSIENVGAPGLKTLDVKFLVYSNPLRKKLEQVPPFAELMDDEFRMLLEQIREEGLDRDYEYATVSSVHLSLLLLKLIRMQYPAKPFIKPKACYSDRNDLSSLVVRMIAFAENNTNRNVTAKDFEKLAGCSYRLLSRLSKAEIGLTPVELAHYHRTLKAKEMLVLTQLDIKQIAENLGFSNIHNFTRFFTRICGTPPGKFRQESLKGIRKDILFDSKFVNKIYTQF